MVPTKLRDRICLSSLLFAVFTDPPRDSSARCGVAAKTQRRGYFASIRRFLRGKGVAPGVTDNRAGKCDEETEEGRGADGRREAGRHEPEGVTRLLHRGQDRSRPGPDRHG